MKEGGSTGFSYALAQLERAEFAGSAHAQRWRNVLSGMWSGALRVGSRTPVKGAPPWVTLEVVHGGFATGGFVASGPLLPHERKQLGKRASAMSLARARLTLNTEALAAPDGLDALLESGAYTLGAPEEGALLVVRALTLAGRVEEAQAVVDEILPFFNRLRFYPTPAAAPRERGVRLRTVKQLRETLECQADRPGAAWVKKCERRADRRAARAAGLRPAKDTAAAVQLPRMQEAVLIWAPLFDRLLSLFSEVIRGATELASPTESWIANARVLLEEYETLRAEHPLCKKPDKKKENFAQLRALLSQAVAKGGLSDRELARTRELLSREFAAHGRPDSEQRLAMREAQRRAALLPTIGEVAQILLSRLAGMPEQDGLTDPDGCLGPVTEAELNALSLGRRPRVIKSPELQEAQRLRAVGVQIPAPLRERVWRAFQGEPEALLARGLVSSSEQLARLIPGVSAEAIGGEDSPVGRLYRELYISFSARRSLLLLNLESQVRLTELPWVAALSSIASLDSSAALFGVLRQVARMTLDNFPETITPNPLVRELSALSTQAGDGRIWLEELAADIFMGRFAHKFTEAARRAGQWMRGSVYARYYQCDYQAVGWPGGGEIDLNAVCERSAPAAAGKWIVRNGQILEQAQLLTTHNLSELIVLWAESQDDLHNPVPGQLGPGPDARLHALCLRCWTFIEGQLLFLYERLPGTGARFHLKLHVVKRVAYAWRQLILLLSWLPEDAQGALLQELRVAMHSSRCAEFGQRFAPALVGLEEVARGARFDAEGKLPSGGRRLLGWDSKHWLLPAREK